MSWSHFLDYLLYYFGTSVPINIHQTLMHQQFLFCLSAYVFSCTMNLLLSCAFFWLLHFKYSFRKLQVELILLLSFLRIWTLSTKLIVFIWKCKTCSLNVTRSCANHLNTFEIYLLRKCSTAFHKVWFLIYT